jgi:hypothetical protein
VAKPRPKPTSSERDARQLELDAARKPAARALPAAQVAAMAKRAVERRGVVAGRVVLRVPIMQDAAEALSARAIRETRNLEDLAAEILEREARQ